MAKQTTSTPPERAGNRAPSRPRGGAQGASSKSAATKEQTSRRHGTSPVTFFQESRAELRKVTWPTRQEAMNLTVAVIGMTAGIAVFLGLVDGALDKIIKPLIGG